MQLNLTIQPSTEANQAANKPSRSIPSASATARGTISDATAVKAQQSFTIATHTLPANIVIASASPRRPLTHLIAQYCRHCASKASSTNQNSISEPKSD